MTCMATFTVTQPFTVSVYTRRGELRVEFDEGDSFDPSELDPAVAARVPDGCVQEGDPTPATPPSQSDQPEEGE